MAQTAELKPFKRLAKEWQCKIREILDKYYSDLCEKYLFAVVTRDSSTTSKSTSVAAVMLYDEMNSEVYATVLWGSLQTAFRALATSKLGLNRKIKPIRIFWEQRRTNIQSRKEMNRVYDSLDFEDLLALLVLRWNDKTELILTEDDVLSDVPDPSELWCCENRYGTAWVSIHPRGTQAVMFHVAPIVHANTTLKKTIDACMTEYEHEIAWKACDVFINHVGKNAAESSLVTMHFRKPLVFWTSSDLLDDVDLRIRDWIGMDRWQPCANKLWQYFERPDTNRKIRKQLKVEKTKPHYLQLQFDDRILCDYTTSTASNFTCVCAVVVETKLSFLPENAYNFPQWFALRNAVVGIEFGVAHSARLIQRAWRRSIADPAYLICRRRLKKEYDAMLNSHDAAIE